MNFSGGEPAKRLPADRTAAFKFSVSKAVIPLSASGPIKRAPCSPSAIEAEGVLRWERQSSTRFRESFALGMLGGTSGAKRALKPRQGWAIRFFLDQRQRLRDRALFDLAIDSKLRGCDVVKIKIGDLVRGGQIRNRAIVLQQKTGRPVQFELKDDARSSLLAWLERRGGTIDDYAFPSRVDHAGHISTRQYARLVDEWVTGVGLRCEDYGTHSLRRRKASLV